MAGAGRGPVMSRARGTGSGMTTRLRYGAARLRPCTWVGGSMPADQGRQDASLTAQGTAALHVPGRMTIRSEGPTDSPARSGAPAGEQEPGQRL